MKIMSKFYTFFLAYLFITVLPSNVLATIWQLDFDGQISDITEYLGEIATETKGAYNFHDDRFYVGQSFYGNFIIDDSVLPSSTLADDPEKDIYSAVIDSFINIEGYTYKKGSTYASYAQIWDRGEPNFIKDVFSVSGNTYIRPFDLGSGSDLSSFRVNLFDRDGDIFSSPNLVDALKNLSLMDDIAQQFEYANLGLLHMSTGESVTNEYLFLDGSLNAVTVSLHNSNPVPEPSTILLLGSGLLGLGWYGRKRKKA